MKLYDKKKMNNIKTGMCKGKAKNKKAFRKQGLDNLV